MTDGNESTMDAKSKPFGMITLDQVGKEYDNKTVLKDIRMQIDKGQSIAITGHNGCGKSTLLKIIAGLVEPSKGKVKYDRQLIFHYVPEHFPGMPMTAEKYLISQGILAGLNKTEAGKRIKTLSEEFFLDSMLKTSMKHLSKGSLQKVAVIQALLKEPDVLLLDEPLSGQDVASQQVFIDKVNALRKKGVVILMSCHEPFLTDAISDTVYQLENGVLTLTEKRNLTEKTWFILEFTSSDTCTVPPQWEGRLQYVEKGCILRVEEKDCNEAALSMLQAGWNLRGVHQ